MNVYNEEDLVANGKRKRVEPLLSTQSQKRRRPLDVHAHPPGRSHIVGTPSSKFAKAPILKQSTSGYIGQAEVFKLWETMKGSLSLNERRKGNDDGKIQYNFDTFKVPSEPSLDRILGELQTIIDQQSKASKALNAALSQLHVAGSEKERAIHQMTGKDESTKNSGNRLADAEAQLKQERESKNQLSFALELERKGRIKLENEAAERLTHMAEELENAWTLEAALEANLNLEIDRNAHLTSELAHECALRIKVESQVEEQIRLMKDLKKAVLDRELRIKLAKRYMEEQNLLIKDLRKAELERQLRQESILKKEQEVQKMIGCTVTISRAGIFRGIGDDGFHKLTPAMLSQLKQLKNLFSDSFQIKKIEYVLNDQLYRQFDETKSKFRRMKRSCQEVLLFHGTKQSNIDWYVLKKAYTNCSILMNGFSIGGVNGFPVANGSALVRSSLAYLLNRRDLGFIVLRRRRTLSGITEAHLTLGDAV